MTLDHEYVTDEEKTWSVIKNILVTNLMDLINC